MSENAHHPLIARRQRGDPEVNPDSILNEVNTFSSMTTNVSVTAPSCLDYIETMLVLTVHWSNGLVLCGGRFPLQSSHFHKQCDEVIAMKLSWFKILIVSLFLQNAAQACLSMVMFVAITFPLKYRLWFTQNSTTLMLLIITCIPLPYWGIYFIDTCNFFYDHYLRIWKFGTQPCSVFLSKYIDMVYNITLFVAVAVLDTSTLLRLRIIRKSTQNRTQKGNHHLMRDEKKRQHKKETDLFVQAFLTSCVYFLMLICFHVISVHASEGFFLFLSTTFVWELSHTLGGAILIWFNPEIRRHLSGANEFIRFLSNPTSTLNVLHITSQKLSNK
ncbi:unnamed protein product [Cylicocyclus nassatus]|uniref:7TM GPCR serpentine receptor class x (Srx) domain-containing protein n=1 Tax=Cylicocyclus nassatus TaxID=53992 RepID=A0AA36HC71_CYLNA|nr:unnamed protein product [Cylicocyclus nassatus]